MRLKKEERRTASFWWGQDFGEEGEERVMTLPKEIKRGLYCFKNSRCGWWQDLRKIASRIEGSSQTRKGANG